MSFSSSFNTVTLDLNWTWISSITISVRNDLTRSFRELLKEDHLHLNSIGSKTEKGDSNQLFFVSFTHFLFSTSTISISSPMLAERVLN